MAKQIHCSAPYDWAQARFYPTWVRRHNKTEEPICFVAFRILFSQLTVDKTLQRHHGRQDVWQSSQKPSFSYPLIATQTQLHTAVSLKRLHCTIDKTITLRTIPPPPEIQTTRQNQLCIKSFQSQWPLCRLHLRASHLSKAPKVRIKKWILEQYSPLTWKKSRLCIADRGEQEATVHER